MPSGWTLLRRNSTYGLRLAKSLLSLMSFCSSFLFPYQQMLFCLIVSRSTFPYFFSSCTFFNFLYFPSCPALPFPKSCWACPLQVPPPAYFLSHLSTLSSHVLYFLSLLHFLIPYFHSFSYFPCLSRTFSLKICWARSLQVPPPAYFLSSRSPVLWILSPLCLYCAFLLFFVLLGFCWKMPLYLTICLFIDLVNCFQCYSFCFEFNA